MVVFPGTATNLIIERASLTEAYVSNVPRKNYWRYFNERQWGVVMDDDNDSDYAWNFFIPNNAVIRAFLRGKKSIAGIPGDKQQRCFSRALMNVRYTVVKECIFRLTNSKGHKGDDTKKNYICSDSWLKHLFMKKLYRYSQPACHFFGTINEVRIPGHHEIEFESHILNKSVDTDAIMGACALQKQPKHTEKTNQTCNPPPIRHTEPMNIPGIP